MSADYSTVDYYYGDLMPSLAEDQVIRVREMCHRRYGQSEDVDSFIEELLYHLDAMENGQ